METELELIILVEKLYRACSNVSLDLVTIQSAGELQENPCFSRIYFDCEDHGPKIIEERIMDNKYIYKTLFYFHNELADRFTEINALIIEGDGEAVSKSICSLSSHLQNLIIPIENHREEYKFQYGLKPFLDYPHIMPGHITQHGNELISMDFNYLPEKATYVDAIDMLKTLNDEFGFNPEFRLIKQLTTDPFFDPATGSESYQNRMQRIRSLLKEHFQFMV